MPKIREYTNTTPLLDPILSHTLVLRYSSGTYMNWAIVQSHTCTALFDPIVSHTHVLRYWTLFWVTHMYCAIGLYSESHTCTALLDPILSQVYCSTGPYSESHTCTALLDPILSHIRVLLYWTLFWVTYSSIWSYSESQALLSWTLFWITHMYCSIFLTPSEHCNSRKSLNISSN
jgi:hypothetical protein